MKKRERKVLNRKDWTENFELSDVAHIIYQGVLYFLNIAWFNDTRVNAILFQVVRIL